MVWTWLCSHWFPQGKPAGCRCCCCFYLIYCLYLKGRATERQIRSIRWLTLQTPTVAKGRRAGSQSRKSIRRGHTWSQVLGCKIKPPSQKPRCGPQGAGRHSSPKGRGACLFQRSGWVLHTRQANLPWFHLQGAQTKLEFASGALLCLY